MTARQTLTPGMTRARMDALVEGHYRAEETGDLEAIVEGFTPTRSTTSPDAPGPLHGGDQIEGFYRALLAELRINRFASSPGRHLERLSQLDGADPRVVDGAVAHPAERRADLLPNGRRRRAGHAARLSGRPAAERTSLRADRSRWERRCHDRKRAYNACWPRRGSRVSPPACRPRCRAPRSGPRTASRPRPTAERDALAARALLGGRPGCSSRPAACAGR